VVAALPPVSPPAATVFFSVVLGCGVGFLVGDAFFDGTAEEGTAGDGAGATALGRPTSDHAPAAPGCFAAGWAQAASAYTIITTAPSRKVLSIRAA